MVGNNGVGKTVEYSLFEDTQRKKEVKRRCGIIHSIIGNVNIWVSALKVEMKLL